MWDTIKQKLETEGAKNKAYDSDVDGVFDLAAIPTITRDKLEYPLNNQKDFGYACGLGKLIPIYGEESATGYHLAYPETYSDKMISAVVKGHANNSSGRSGLYGRSSDHLNWYSCGIDTGASTADFRIRKNVNGTPSDLASESVDLNYGVPRSLALSISGSTIKAFRGKGNPPPSGTTPTISATDTDFASGYFGFGIFFEGLYEAEPTSWNLATGGLYDPLTELPKPITIVEIDQLKQNLVEISQINNAPEFLKQEYKKYELLKQKGFTDEEIKLLLGDIQTHVDVASVTWGAFDHKPGHNTMLITITGGNPYTGEKAITEQIEHAKSKGLKVLSPPRDYSEAIEQYRQLKKDFPEWIAGKENYIYQCGFDVEPLACADFYYGELIEHKTHYKQLKRVPEWELERTIKRWRDLHKYAKAPKEEIEKHAKKLDEVLRVGW